MPRGVFESWYRSSYPDTDNKDSRKHLTDYVKGEYVADKLTKFERSDPKDFTQPFQMTVEASPAKRGWTNLESAEAAIRRESLFYWLPDELQQAKQEEKKKDKDAITNHNSPPHGF